MSVQIVLEKYSPSEAKLAWTHYSLGVHEPVHQW